MSLEDLIQKLKTGEAEEVDRAKKNLKKVFKNQDRIASKRMISELEDYYMIDKEKNKIAFIYGLRLAARERGREFFPLFTDFITKNIQNDSGNVRRAVIRLSETLIESLLIESEELSKEEKKVFTGFVDDILLLLEFHYDQDYEDYEEISEIPPCKYKSLEMLLSKIINPGKKDVAYEKNAGMPSWMDCTWRRIPCMKDDCPICRKLDEIGDRDDLFERGDFLIEIAQEESEMEEDLPSPEEFPFYLEIRDWLENLISIAEKSKEEGDFWIFTEEAADLFWYMNVLSAKTYRQLCNRHLIESLNESNFIDYKYTKYVLTEALKKIKKSIKEISKSDPTDMEELEKSLDELSEMEERLFNI